MTRPAIAARAAVLGLVALAACGDDGAPADAGLGDAGLDAGGPDGGRIYVPAPFSPTDATREYCARDADAIEARITGWLAELSVREKVALVHGAGLAIVDGAWLLPGHARLGIPGLHMLDGPRGLSRFSGKRGTAFPVAMMRGATWDPELERRVGAAMAREHRSAGADVILAPTINILRHPRWGRAQETYGEDVHHLGAFGVAFIEGAQSEGVIASAKHFAANSIEDTRHSVDVVVDERTLREIYLPHFRRAVREARVGSVMSAYNRVNGLYCDLQDHLLRDILKGEWEFQGFVESDWIAGTHASAESLRAGLDVEMPSGANFRRLPGEVESGELDEGVLDDAVRRVVRAQLCFGLDERERVLDDPDARETPEHLALAREVARRGVVLLRNELVGGAPALPLDPAARLVVAGRLADVANIGDEGSSSVSPTDVVTALEGLRERSERVTHLPGGVETDADRDAVAAADAVVVITGLAADDEGEATIGAGDRDTLALSADEVALVLELAALHPVVIVVLEGGAAITVEPFVDAVEALLFAAYPGAEGGRALADLLFGDHAPSGRLPFSIPVDEADLPEFDNVSERVTYGYFHGYRHLAREGRAPRFAFGAGLSYTTFDIGPPTVSEAAVDADGAVEVTVEVTNTGERRGRETVQLYASAPGSAVTRAEHDLRAFAQIELDPAETGAVTLPLSAADLAYYDVDAARWVVEPLDYELRVGRSAVEILHTASLTVR